MGVRTGNPKGRPKGSRSKKTLATEKQIKKLKQAGADPKDYIAGVMKGTHEYDPIKMRAAEILMEYTYAKLQRTQVQAEVTVRKDPSDYSDADLAAIIDAGSEAKVTH